ncbi:type IV pilus twitching motility protein PilT [Alicyclobacillus fastidiosus]|uniref:Type IV pilus twitching motility protein PilT n=1 Tax=Alicyclobacillus fastidiosus TaxID=392011 RepID=A0ABV5AG88_9BACL|nr:type IV pilus twitching motility protein PilT [Alicyclobacillus fastidiosus]WEH11672.1 type IV pilus twitching motility protein PilT [Alicyclobacillus fastidiosus]
MRVDELLTRAVELNASDIHLGVGHAPTLRVNGELVSEGVAALNEDIETWTRQLLSEQELEQLHEFGEVDLSYRDRSGMRYRVNAFLQQGYKTLAIRVIPSRIPTLSDLGLPAPLTKLGSQPHGLILVTGPTGSGKTTTLASLIQHINTTSAKHIITLEDPIEYIHPHAASVIHQRQIGRDTLGFAPALRAALRQDPDVILVGELRDQETVQTAITASETGHLVLSTLHTGDAVQTIDRLIDMFPSHQQGQIRSQLSSVLLGVVSQRLLPRTSGGRVALAELLINTAAVANLIRTQKTHQLKSVMQTSRQLGMQTFAMAARERLQSGQISSAVAGTWMEATS